MVPDCGSTMCHSDCKYCGKKKETIKFSLKLAAIRMTDLADSVVICTPLIERVLEQNELLGLDSPRCIRAIIQYCVVMHSFAGETSSLPNTTTAMDKLCSRQMSIPNVAIGNDGLHVSTLTATFFLHCPGHG